MLTKYDRKYYELIKSGKRKELYDNPNYKDAYYIRAEKAIINAKTPQEALEKIQQLMAGGARRFPSDIESIRVMVEALEEEIEAYQNSLTI